MEKEILYDRVFKESQLPKAKSQDKKQCGRIRINKESKAKLLKMYFFDHKKLKEASVECGISYSAGKRILKAYRQKQKVSKSTDSFDCENKQCHYKIIQLADQMDRNSMQLNVISIQGGQIQSQVMQNYCSSMIGIKEENLNNESSFARKESESSSKIEQ